MNYNEIIGLVQTFDKSSLTKLKFEEGGQIIELEKGHLNKGCTDSNQMIQPAVNHVNETVTASAPVYLSEPTNNNEDIPAPLVGIFYASGAPGDDAFVKIGDRVNRGAPLCILEAMKVMNEVVAPYDLIVREICVSNEALVEFGQPLFKVEKA